MAKSRKIRSIKIRVKDAAFHNTVRFGFRLVAGPLTFLLWALIFFLTLPWWTATALLILFMFSYSLFYDLRLQW